MEGERAAMQAYYKAEQMEHFYAVAILVGHGNGARVRVASRGWEQREK